MVQTLGDLNQSVEQTLVQTLAQRRLEQAETHFGDEPVRKLVIFRLDEELFAFLGENVREILPMGRLFFVPGCPTSLDGVINVRGDIESVISLFTLLGKPVPESHAEEAILLGKAANMQSGIRVGRVVDVLDVLEKDIQPPSDHLPEQIFRLVRGLTMHAGMAVLILDMESLFNDFISRI